VTLAHPTSRKRTSRGVVASLPGPGVNRVRFGVAFDAGSVPQIYVSFAVAVVAKVTESTTAIIGGRRTYAAGEPAL